MKITSNFLHFHDVFGLEKTIDIFAEAGFSGIDFGADHEEYYTDAHDAAFYENIRKYAADKGVVFEQAHAPYPSSFLDAAESEKRFFEIVKSMETASRLGAKILVVHPCRHLYYKEENNYDLILAYNLAFYRRLLPYAEKFHIKIGIENIRSAITETPEGFLALLEALDSEVFTVCLDVGHANRCGRKDAVEMIKKLGRHIGCTHIHDNEGGTDLHTLPYLGNIDWEAVMKAFAEVGYTGNFNYEAGLFVEKFPLPLRQECARYMVQVGKYLCERYYYYKKEAPGTYIGRDY